MKNDKRDYMKKNFIFIFLFLITSLPLFAQKMVSGIVTDEDGLPVNAIISSKDNSSQTNTNKNGSFTISLKKLPDMLTITSTGFKPQFYAVTDEKYLNIVLVSHIGTLDEVVIKSKKVDKQLIKIDLEKTPVNTAQDLLRKVPGLFIAQHAGGGKAEQIFLRGFDNDHGTDIAISADDMPVNMPSHAHGQGYSDLHFLIPETIQNIDFGKGSYYADKGDFNTSGYVNFHTYDSISQSYVKAEAGNFNTMRIMGMADLLKGNSLQQNAFIAGEYNYTDGPFDVKQDFKRFNLFGKYNQKIGSQGELRLEASCFNSSWNASGQIPERAVAEGLVGRFGSIDPTEGGNTHRTNLLASYTYKASENQTFKTTFYYINYLFNLYSNFTFYLIHPDAGDEINQYDNRAVYGMNTIYTNYFTFDRFHLNLNAGFGGRFDDIKDLELSYVTARYTLNERLAWGAAKEANVNSFISADLSTGKWRLNAGLRADWFYFNYYDKLQPNYAASSYSKARISPKLSLFYNASDQLTLYVKSGLGFHSNDVRDVVLQQGTNILPYSFGVDVGCILKPAKGLVLQPILWNSYLNHEFVWNGDSYGTSDAGATRRYGVDISTRYQILPFLYLDNDINWAVPRVVGAPRGDNYVELAPTLTSTGGLGFQFQNGFYANLRYRYMHDRPAVQDASIVAQGYFVNDLISGYQAKKWGINLQIQNLFNTKWNEAMFAQETRLKGESASVEELTFTPGTPFMVKIGLTYKI